MTPPPLIERYRERLPLEPGDPVVSLNEGSTPLIEAPAISERVGVSVYLKLEGANPTGSFKDRGMTLAVSRAKGAGAEAIICASTGNTAASAAAYAARAGLRGAVIVPEGKIAIGKLAQALMHGARVIALRGNFDQALEIVRELARRHPVELVNSINPYRIEGQKTAAFEACDELGGPPDALAIPVGNAGNITAWWRGFQEYGASPVLYGFQAEGAAPLVHGKPVAEPETIASAIRIGNPARWEEAMEAVTGSRGRIAAVSDEQILDAYRLLASREGVFCEPASAASVAGILAHGLPAPEGGEPAGLGPLRAHRPRPQGPRHGARQGARGDRLRGGARGGGAGGLRLDGFSWRFGRCARHCATLAGRGSSPMLAELLGLVVPPRCAVCAAGMLARGSGSARDASPGCAGSRRARRRFPGWTPPGPPRRMRASPGTWWWRSSSVRGCRSPARGRGDRRRERRPGCSRGRSSPCRPPRRAGDGAGSTPRRRSRRRSPPRRGCRWHVACGARRAGGRSAGRDRSGCRPAPGPPRAPAARRRRPGGRRGHDGGDDRRLRAGAALRRLQPVVALTFARS